MTGPSANGSEKGKPISIKSTPAFSRFLTISSVSFNVGYPAVK
jgi:hypothetical protein